MITINEYMCLNDINPGQRALVGELAGISAEEFMKKITGALQNEPR